MTFTRRAVLASTALAIAPMGGQALAQTPAANPPASGRSPAGLQAPGFYRYKIGDIEVTAINDGFAKRPLEGFIKNAELQVFIQASREHGLKILWVAVRHSAWEATPLSHYQAVNDPEHPLEELEEWPAKQDKELIRICKEIKKALDS